MYFPCQVNSCGLIGVDGPSTVNPLFAEHLLPARRRARLWQSWRPCLKDFAKHSRHTVGQPVPSCFLLHLGRASLLLFVCSFVCLFLMWISVWLPILFVDLMILEINPVLLWDSHLVEMVWLSSIHEEVKRLTLGTVTVAHVLSVQPSLLGYLSQNITK